MLDSTLKTDPNYTINSSLKHQQEQSNITD
jgi:hypothetical protein